MAMNKDKINPVSHPSDTIPVEEVLRYKNIWRSIAYLIMLVIIVLSLIPDPGDVTPFSASDKLMHILAYAVSMLWFGLCLSLGGCGMMLQPAFSDCLFLDLLSHLQDFGTAAEVDVCRRQVGQALVVAMVVVVIDEGGDLSFEVSGQVVVFH